MYLHQPVLLEEVLQGCALREGDTVLDGTVGLGGHAQALAQAIGPSGLLIGVDRDRQALLLAGDRLKQFGERVKLIHGHCGELSRILGEMHVDRLQAAFFDLGVSSMQLENQERGFSFAREGPLDMRMDQSQPLDASCLVNQSSYPELVEMVKGFGEERFASRIARIIVDKRPFATTTELAEAIRRAVPRGRHLRIDPATRTFQAIRIAVNRELDLLPQGLSQAMERLAPKGRMVVLSYHSLEDRIVKNFLRTSAREGRCRLITKKPIRPSPEEVGRNPRSRSARLRVGEWL